MDSEDCLYVQITTKKSLMQNRNAEKLPYVQYIHGGGYNFGNGADTNWTNLINNQNVLVATIQYRLGFFGFGIIPENEERYQASS